MYACDFELVKIVKTQTMVEIWFVIQTTKKVMEYTIKSFKCTLLLSFFR